MKTGKLAARVDAGEILQPDQVRADCDDHVTKQSEGALSTTLMGSPSTGVDRALRTILSSNAGSREWKAAKETADIATEAKQRRNPQHRHSVRMASLYVDLAEDGSSWIIPSAGDEAEARKEIGEAVSDYANERSNLCDVNADPEMTRARASIPLAITMPQPIWPNG